MGVVVIPTLAAMADVYGMTTDGGADSARFRAYVATARSGAPVAHYNPMTSKPAGETVAALLEVDAERLAAAAATAVLEELDVTAALEMFFTVATPGMWTDRRATEAEHLLGGKRSSEIVFWTGEATDEETVSRRARAQAVRALWAQVHGSASRTDTVRAAVAREGIALATGRDGPTPARSDAVAEAIDVLGAETGLGDRVAVVLGDRFAEAMGFTTLGLDDLAGARHGAARAETSKLSETFVSGPAAPWLSDV